MTTTEIKVIELRASEGHWITQVSEVPEEERVFSDWVIIGDANNNYWRECTNKEKEEWEKNHPVEEEPIDEPVEELQIEDAVEL